MIMGTAYDIFIYQKYLSMKKMNISKYRYKTCQAFYFINHLFTILIILYILCSKNCTYTMRELSKIKK